MGQRNEQLKCVQRLTASLGIVTKLAVISVRRNLVFQPLWHLRVKSRVCCTSYKGRVEEEYYYFSPPIRNRACDFHRTRLLNQNKSHVQPPTASVEDR
ncbi:hypothetical protein [Coleofasciculus sp. FACHB-125]|uniref:hypothetical protein n=1 Tax=Coleofasciculus sp. FACHB-125 TaxID=2692784 RepID=UPI0030DD3FCF